MTVVATGNGLIATGTLRVMWCGEAATVMIGADCLAELLRRRFGRSGSGGLVCVVGVRVSVEQCEDGFDG